LTPTEGLQPAFMSQESAGDQCVLTFLKIDGYVFLRQDIVEPFQIVWPICENFPEKTQEIWWML